MISALSRAHEIQPRPQWLEPSNRYGWHAVLRNVLPLVLLLASAPWLASLSALAAWLLAPLIGLFLYRITVVMHDCTHQTLFTSRRLNVIMGQLLGGFSGVDFNSFCRQHWRHHRAYGRAGDPQGFQYAELGRMTPRELRWHALKPLLGANLPHVFAESILAPRNFIRLLRTGEIMSVAPPQLLMLALVTGFGSHAWLALLPYLSGATFALFFSQLRGMAEHGSLETDSYQVRSHQPRWLDRIFFYDIHFNYHAEHHALPHIPSCHLPALHRAMNASGASASMFQTLRALHEESKALHG
jgi:fatty acid desaturase